MTAPGGPFLIGIMGGVASGKSEAAAFFAAMGARVVDADAIAAKVLGIPEVREEIAARFGSAVTAPDGSVDRAALAEAAFGAGAEGVHALDAIMHPRVLEEVERGIAAAGMGEAVVLDLPLLYEAGLAGRCDLLVFIDAPEANRARFAAKRGWAAGEAGRRQAAQASLDLKKKCSGISIKNDKTLDDLGLSVQNVWRKLVRPHLFPVS